jgi:hypothetical protein
MLEKCKEDQLDKSVRNKEMLHRNKEERNILYTIKRRKTNWTGPILRRNCLRKHTVEEKVEGIISVTEREGRRRNQLPDDLKEKSGHRKLKEEALDRTLWRTRYGKRYGSLVIQTKK